MQHDVLGGDTRRNRAVQLDAQHFGHGDPDGAGHERVGHVGRADAERDAAQRAAVRRVRIGAGDELARQRVALRHQRVRYALRARVVRVARREVAQVAVIGEPMARDESAVRVRKPAHAADEPAAHVHGTLMHIGQVILERDDGGRIVQFERRAERAVEQVTAHARVVLVDETAVGAHEPAVARVPRRGQVGGGDRMPRDDLGKQRAWALNVVAGAPGRGAIRRASIDRIRSWP